MDADVTESEELDKLYVQFYRKGRVMIIYLLFWIVILFFAFF